jgi:hypothetical protein
LELVYVVVGGIIAILGGAATTFFSHKLGRRESARSDLISAYVEWSARLSIATEEWKQLEFFDHVAALKDKNEELQSIPTSPAGRTREEIVRDKLGAMSELQSACSRVLLAETDKAFADWVIRISTFELGADVGRRPDLILGYADRKTAESQDLMRALRREHPVLKGP